MFSLRHRSVRSSRSLFTTLLLFAAVVTSFRVFGIISSVGAESSLNVSESVTKNSITLTVPDDKSFTFYAVRPKEECLEYVPDVNSITFSYGDDNCEMGLKWTKKYVSLLVNGAELYNAWYNGEKMYEVIIKGAESSLTPNGFKLGKEEPCTVNFKKLPSGRYSVNFVMTRVVSKCNEFKVEFAYPEYSLVTYKPTDSHEKNTEPPGHIKETTFGYADIGTTDLTTGNKIETGGLSPWIWISPLIVVFVLLLVGGVVFYFLKIRRKGKKPVDIDFVNREADEGSSSQEQSDGIEKKHKSLPLRRPDNAKPVEVRSVRAVALPADSDDVVVSMESNKGQKKQPQFNYHKDFVETPAPVGWTPEPPKKQKKVKGYVPQPPVNYQKDFVETPAPKIYKSV